MRQATYYRDNRPLLERAQQRQERQSRARSQPPTNRGRSSSRAPRHDSRNPPPFLTGGNAQRLPPPGQLSNQELGFYQRLPPPWNVCPTSEAIKTSDLEKIVRGHEFKEGYLAYRTFRTWFIRRVHSTFNSIGEKCEVLAACIKTQPSVTVLAETQRGDSISYRMMIHELEREFGDPQKHQSNFISDVESWSTIKYHDLIKLQQASQRIRAYLSDRMSDQCGITEGEVKAEYAAIFRKMDNLMIMKWDDWRGIRNRKPDLWALADFFDNARHNQQDGISRQPRKGGAGSAVTFVDGVEIINDSREELRNKDESDHDAYQSSGDRSLTSSSSSSSGTYYPQQEENRQSANRVMSGNNSNSDRRSDRRDDSNSRQDGRNDRNSSGNRDNRSYDDNRGRSRDSPRSDRDRNWRDDRSRSRSPSPYKKRDPFCHVCPKPAVPHWTKQCAQFAQLPYAQKTRIVKEKEMCPRCLVPGHKLAECQSKTPCQACASMDHHSLLHNYESDSEKSKGQAGSDKGATNKTFGIFNAVKKEVEGAEYAPIHRIYALRVIAVRLIGPSRKTKVVNALLDDGSNRTLIDMALAKELELVHDHPIRLNLEGVAGSVCLEDNSHLVKLEIESLDTSFKDEIRASTLQNPVGDLKCYRWNTFKKLWPHIEHLEFPELPGAKCHLLLGSDFNHLLASRQEIIPEGIGEPFPIARLTKLGWTCTGILAPGDHHEDRVNLIKSFGRRYFTQTEIPPRDSFREGVKIPSGSSNGDAKLRRTTTNRGRDLNSRKIKRLRNSRLHFHCENFEVNIDHEAWKLQEMTFEAMKSNLDAEASKLDQLRKEVMHFETFPGDNDDVATRSQQDVEALRIMRESRKKVGNQYQVSVLWRPGEPDFENNFSMAKKRLESLERSYHFKDPALKAAFWQHVKDWEAKGYFVRVPPERMWIPQQRILPMFPVVRTDKTTTKIRPVLDGAAKYKGKSVNDACFKGPNVINNLPSVLTRFRKYQIALGGDVAEMFLQILNYPEDRQYQRILFRENPYDEIQMLEPHVHIFGNAGSPCIAIYTITEHARENAHKYPRASEAVQKSSIVDDIMDSVQTVDEAIRMYKDLKTLFKECGMNIRKFFSNHDDVLSAIPTRRSGKKY